MPRNALIKFRGGTAAAWAAANPVLDRNEPGREEDSGKVKLGDGVTAWNSLPYFQPGNGTSLVLRAADYGWSTSATAAANDTAIAAAIAAAQAAGATGLVAIDLGVGTFQTSAPINAKATSSYGSGVELFGRGTNRTTVVNVTDTSELLQVGGFRNYFHDFTVKHSSDTPSGTTGDGLVFYKCAYSTFKRLNVVNAGRSVAIAQSNVSEPGTGSGAGNYMFSNTFEDININRYAVSGLYLNGYSGGSSGSAWTNIYVQNLSSGGSQLSATGNAVDIALCDSVFNQLNIEDLTNTKALLVNAQTTVVISGLHLERVHRAAGNHQVQAYGGAMLTIDGVSIQGSNLAITGTSGNSHHFNVAAGGQMKVTGLFLNQNVCAGGATYSLGEVGDTNAKNSLEIGGYGANANATLTVESYSTSNPGLKRIGDALYGLATQPSVVATATLRPRANSVALLGTSITHYNIPYDQGGGAMALQGEGFWYQANAMLRQDGTLILEAGVPGDTTGAMLARVGTIIAAKPAYCVVETGPNDVQGDSTFENITGSLAQIYAALLAAGITVFAGEINPTTTINGTASRIKVMRRVNRWISDYARSNPGVVPVKWSGPMSDPATGGPLTSTLHDGTHPNTLGSAIMGRALAAAMRPYVTPLDSTTPTTNSDPTNGLSNPLLTGDGGSGVATGWTLTNQGGTAVFTASKVARTDGGPGEWQQIALTSGEVRLIQAAPSGGVWAVGDKVRAEIEVDGDFTNATTLVLFCQALSSGGSVIQQTLGLQDYHSTPKRIPYSRAVIRTADLTIPASTNSVSLQARVVGASTARFSAASIRNIVL